MPEGDTIHRLARRLGHALEGRSIDRAEASDRRSPVAHRAGELQGRTLEHAEARGKHLLLHFSEGLAVHSHLGMNGRWRVDAAAPPSRPAWLLLVSDGHFGAQFGGRLLRIVNESRLRNDPGLLQLGPDPLRPGFDGQGAALRLIQAGAGMEVGEALLEQSIVAGIGNVIRVEACFRARVSPWRPVDGLVADEALRLIAESEWVMRTSLKIGKRPSSIYGKRGRPCPRCGELIRSHGQGDGNRITYWCKGCQH